MTQTEHEKTEASIDQKTTISLWLVGALVVGAIGITLWQYEQKDAVLTEIRELRADIEKSNIAIDKRVTSVEETASNLTSNSWTSAMMEIWVLRSRQQGELVDPAPIMERHSK